MGSLTEGSANVASQITEDLTGQLVTIDAGVSDLTRGALITSDNGTVFKLTVTDGGTLAATSV